MKPNRERMLSMEKTREEVKAENISREKIAVENRVQLMDLEFANGEIITISGNDISIIERFELAGDELQKLDEKWEKQEAEEEPKDYRKKIENRRCFSEEASRIMDGVFGEGTTRKFFGDVYAVIPDFCPDLECFMDWWDSLIPVIEKLADHKIKLEKLASKRRMEKFQPQDHNKPGKKK